ncbi:MAG TPA: hypothetical protein VLV83_08155, partial [Acidobacteriota bacterium]|nr:hypothetical protein [Acidobacteriota bacterium]
IPKTLLLTWELMRSPTGWLTKAISEAGAMAIPERLNQLNAYLGILPEKPHYNLRRQYVMDANAADLFDRYNIVDEDDPHSAAQAAETYLSNSAGAIWAQLVELEEVRESRRSG